MVTGAAGATTPLASLTARGNTVSVSAVNTTGSQTYTGASGITLDGNLATSGGAITATGPVNLTPATQNINTANGAITFDGILTGSAAALTTNSGTGTTTFGGAAILSTLDSTAGTIRVQSVTTTGTAGQVYRSPVILTANSIFDAGTAPIDFDSTVDSDANNTPRSLTASTSGATFFRDAVGAGSSLNTFTVNGGGTTTLNSNVTTQFSQTYVDAVILDPTNDGQTFTLTGGDIDFQNTLMVDVVLGNAAESLVVNGGNVTFGSGVVGSGSNLTVVGTGAVVAGGGIGAVLAPLNTTSLRGSRVNVTDVTTTGNQTYVSTSTSTDATVNTGVTASGILMAARPVGSTASASIVVNAGRLSTGRTVSATNGVFLLGGLNLTGNAIINGNFGEVFIDQQAGSAVAISTNSPSNRLVLQSDLTGDIDISSVNNPTLPDIVTTPFKIGGDIGEASARILSVRINSSTTEPVNGVSLPIARTGNAASIVFGDYDSSGTLVTDQGSGIFNVFIGSGSNNLLGESNVAFEVGRGERILSTRALNINAADTADTNDGNNANDDTIVRLGDVGAVGDVRIRSERVILRSMGNRAVATPPSGAADQIPSAAFTLSNDAVTVASGGSIDLNIGPDGADNRVVESDGDSPTFMQNGTGGLIGNIGSFSRFQTKDGFTINSNILRRGSGGGATVRPLVFSRAQGNSTGNVANDIAGAIPRDTESREVTTQTTVSRALREDLIDLGVNVRDIDADELLLSLGGRNIYLYPRPRESGPDGRVSTLEGAIMPEESDYRVAVPRVPVSSAEKVVGYYRENLKGRDKEITAAIDAAWEVYAVTVPDDDADGMGFRQFLDRLANGQLSADEQAVFNDIELVTAEAKEAAVPAAQASIDYLTKMGEAFTMIDDLGLAPREAQVVKLNMIGKLYKGTSVLHGQLFAAITGLKISRR